MPSDAGKLHQGKPLIIGSGAGGIRTLGTVLRPYNGLANHRLQPLGHSSFWSILNDLL